LQTQRQVARWHFAALDAVDCRQHLAHKIDAARDRLGGAARVLDVVRAQCLALAHALGAEEGRDLVRFAA